MQMAKDKGAMMPTPEAISEKISAKMKLANDKAAVMPTSVEAVKRLVPS